MVMYNMELVCVALTLLFYVSTHFLAVITIFKQNWTVIGILLEHSFISLWNAGERVRLYILQMSASFESAENYFWIANIDFYK